MGRGQVEPDPSRFGLRTTGVSFIAVAAVMAVAVASRFVFGTLLADRGDSLQTTAATALVMGVAFVLAGRGSSAGAPRTVRNVGAAALGALVAAVVPFIALSNQHSDAPTGTLVLFWTTVIPGALLLVIGLRGGIRARLVALAFALAATASAAGILGNWERPSSFSLLTRHVPEQLWLGVAALVWTVGIVALAALARSGSWGLTMRWAGIGGIAGAVLAALLSSDPFGAVAQVADPTVLAYALASAVVVVAALLTTFRGQVAAAASGSLAAPTVLSLLVFLEAAVGALGPEPILRVPVMWGSALLVTALVAASLSGLDERRLPRTRTFALGLRALAVLGVGMGSIALVAAGVDVAVQGRLADTTRFAADFTMAGFETVGAWIALAAAAIAWTIADRRPPRWVALSSAVVVFVSAGAWKVLGYTPLHTWVSWIPAEVQQDYGTEYASMVLTPVAVVWQIAAVCAAVAVALAVTFEAFRAGSPRASASAEESEVS